MASSSTGCLRIDMASLSQILSRTFFWSYERGTWQYDLAVILILVFVLLTPRNLFHDKPHEDQNRSEEHTSELQSHSDLVCRLLLEKKKKASRRRIASPQAPHAPQPHP